MIGWLTRRAGPIGVDIGRSSVKLLQCSVDRARVVEAACWDIPAGDGPDEAADDEAVASALTSALQSRKFRGRDAVLCLNSHDMTVQNIRVPKTASGERELYAAVRQEAARRLPFPLAEMELRFLDVADVRQADATLREVVLLACHRSVLQRKIDLALKAGLQPVSVDVESLALLRCYARQFRRDDDQRRRTMFVHVGASSTLSVIAQGSNVSCVKHIAVGGRHFDEAVASQLNMSFREAAALRRNNGERRADQQDPVIVQSVAEAVRPVVERMLHELSLCLRYHSVAFRGPGLAQLTLSGGEANQALADLLTTKLGVKCELGDPLRPFEASLPIAHRGQWDVAAGLAMREVGAKG